jgi:hypothetical protein
MIPDPIGLALLLLGGVMGTVAIVLARETPPDD